MSFVATDLRSKNNSTTSFQSTGRRQSRWHRYTKQTRTPFELQHNENDREIWIDSGDCHVYLDDTSAVSTSYKLNASTLREQHATYLLRNVKPPPRPYSLTSSDSSDSGYESAAQHPIEIHIAVPVGLNVDEITEYHITTRNYFAYLHDKPLAGSSLGSAARDVWSRIQRWNETGDIQAFLEYCKRQGYLEIMDQPDNALAMLSFAESARLRPLWVNAFAHCVAMQDQLYTSPEYTALTNTAKALITKASLEMDLHLRRTIIAVSNFLEAELSSEMLGLSKPARDQLDQFRGLLQTFFVDKFGYYPPTENEDEFDKCIWKEVHDDFQCLYEYLADTESLDGGLSDRGVTGGVCVQQNVEAFNQRHNLQALQHPLPLLPSLAPMRRATESQVSIRNFKIVRVESDFRPSIREALEKAANADDEDILQRPIVQEYIRFEAQRLEGKLPIAEARKIRWLLIYSTLQLLKSLVLAPEHVSDADTAHYPLCVNVACCPIWSEEGSSPPTRTHSHTSTKPALGLVVPTSDDTDRISIHPDCEADSAQDFFSLNRRGSIPDKSEDDEPQSATKSVAPSLTRSLSIRTSVHSSMNALQRSVMGSLSRRSSARKSPQPALMKIPSLQDITASTENITASNSMVATPTAIDEFTFDIPRTRRLPIDCPVPVLEADEFDMITPSYSTDHTLDDDQFSPISDRSNRSSTHSDCDTPITEPSSRSNSTRESKTVSMLAPLDEDSILVTPEHRPRPAFQQTWSSSSLSAGCYVPSGFSSHEAPVSKFARRQVYERRSSGRDGDVPVSPKENSALKRSNATKRLSMNDGRYTWGDMP